MNFPGKRFLLGILLLQAMVFNTAYSEESNLFKQIKRCGSALYSFHGYAYAGQGNSLYIATPDADHTLLSLNTKGSIRDMTVFNDLLYVLTKSGIEERNFKTGELLNQIDLPSHLRSEKISLNGMKAFEGKFYIAAGRSVLVFDSLNKSFKGKLELPNLNPKSGPQSAYVDVALFNHYLIFLVDDETLNTDPQGRRAFSGFVVYDINNGISRTYDSIIDPGFEDITIVNDRILITSFLPAWTFSANALTEYQQPKNLKKIISLGGLGRMKSGKIFVDNDKNMIYACLAEKSVLSIVPLSADSIK